MQSALRVIGLVCLCVSTSVSPASEPSPNVLLMVMDDMGYGDLSCHGSPFIKTPNLDSLHADALRFTNFHVTPMCSPTRGQLLTGCDSMRNGASIVASSRMMVRAGLPMMPEMFAAAGYATGLFGKWHLGENHPHRPQDRGWQESLWFPIQEIGSVSDFWCNDYFNPVLRRRDGKREKIAGYCTDVFVEQAITWMQTQHEAHKPFLCYLPFNVCHGPQWAPIALREDIARQFPELTPGQVGYLAMLANADGNIGRLERFLTDAGLRENTIVIFISDNGGYALVGKYNAGMRDGKSRLAEGGHRVPCFVRWPRHGIAGGRDVSGLTQVQDLLPTLLELSGVPPTAQAKFDGISLAAALRGEAPVPERTLIVQYGIPEPFRMTCVMRGSWRLLSDIKGPAKGDPELYDLSSDPLQRTNLIDQEPAVAAELRVAYDSWWNETKPLTKQRAFISLGHEAQPVVTLGSAEWRDNAMGSVDGLRQGVKRRGVWDVEVARAGQYEISLRRWPEESGLSLGAAAPSWTPHDTTTPEHAALAEGVALPIAGAQLRVGEMRTALTVTGSEAAAVFSLDLPIGRTELEASFTDASGKHLCAAFFVTVRKIPDRNRS